MNISIKELPDYEVAYVRHLGSYLGTGGAWVKLNTWASKHSLYPPEHIFIGISLDDPAVTEEDQCRYDACVTIQQDFSRDSDPEVNYRTLNGGTYALYQFYGTLEKFSLAYQVVYGQWLPSSQYEPDDRHCLEFCMNNPLDDPEDKAKIDLYIPIRLRGQ